MLDILLYLVATASVIGIIWLIHPYRSWKATRKVEQQTQITIITSDLTRHTL